MTLNIIANKNGDRKVQNTKSTTANFNQGKIKINGDFENSGIVNVDVRANLNILGNILNSGTFNIKDYIAEKHYSIIESAINDTDGISRDYLSQSYAELKKGNFEQANNKFKQFTIYIQQHPELITSSISILLQLFK